MGAIDNWKPTGPSHPLLTAVAAVVLAWIASLVIISHGTFYGSSDESNASVIRLAKLSVVVPVALTGVSFLAALRDWHSRIAWGATSFQLLYSCILLLLFFPVIPICLLYFLSVYFQFRTAGSIARNKELKAERHDFR